MRWQRGQGAVADLLEVGELIPIEGGPARADQLLARARLELAGLGEPGAALGIDPAVDRSSRIIELCAAALLAAQGLEAMRTERERITSIVMDHQFLGDLGAGPFDALRDHNPTTGGSVATALEAAEGPSAATWAVEFTTQLLRSGHLHAFTPS